MRIHQTRDLELVREYADGLLPGHEYVDDDYTHARWWFAIDDAQVLVAGFAGITTHEQPPGEAFMLACGVPAQYRGQGLQQRLIRARLAWARKEGLDSVWTYCHTSNVYSMANLVKCGFVPYKSDLNYLELSRTL